jgi:hypothetical protein
MPDENVHREIVLVKLDNDHKLALRGLQGTLYGALGSLFAIIAIAVIQVLSGRNVIEGWAFAFMVLFFTAPVALYGAFIFNRTLNISAGIAKEGGTVTAKTEGREPR